jgi:glutaminyl-peptide cyclotransferase
VSGSSIIILLGLKIRWRKLRSSSTTTTEHWTRSRREVSDDSRMAAEQVYRSTQTNFSENNILSVAYTNMRKLFGGSATSSSTTHNVLAAGITRTGNYRLLETVPHNTSSYTQGLSILNMNNSANVKISVLLEGTGLNGRSALQYVNITNGKILQQYSLPRRFFGEGITPYNYYPQPNMLRKRIIQITWQEQTAFVYDVFDNFTIETEPALLFSPAPILNFTYQTTTNEGWGIVYRPDQHVFYVSDGSSNIHIWNASTFQQIRVQKVAKTCRGFFGLFAYRSPVSRLNELEWDPISQTILANVYLTNRIVRIDPTTGNVVSEYNLQRLYWPRPLGVDVLNGIALTKNFETDRNNEVWVTGKLWPSMYRIQLIG